MSKRRLSRRERFETKFRVNPQNGCWEWTTTFFSNGYALFYWGVINGKEVTRKGSRVAWELYRGPIPDDLHVLHTCDNKKCVNPDHLFLGTHQDNMDDKRHKGRQHTGEQLYNFKRTQELTARVVKLRSQGMKISQIRQELGIGNTTVHRCLESAGYPRQIPGTYPRDEETRRRSSEAHMGQPGWNKGIPMSESAKEKLRAKKIGMKHTPETRAKMVEAQKLRWKHRKGLS